MAAIATLSLLVLGTTIGTLLAAPSYYQDQRQEGEYNVQAHLENFIVVLIPTSSLSWLNFAKRFNLQNHLESLKTVPSRAQEKSSSVQEDQGEQRVAPPELLSKTPYTVDVEIKSKSSPLSRLHPIPVPDISRDVVIALSPSVSLTKYFENVPESIKTPPAPEAATETPVKLPKAPEKVDVIPEISAFPEEETTTPVKAPQAPELATEAALQPQEVKPLEEPARTVKKSKSILSTTLERVQKAPKATEAGKMTDSEKELRLRLLGAGIEVCAPHERRGNDGNCEPIKPRNRSSQYFESSGLLPALRFGLSPANE